MDPINSVQFSTHTGYPGWRGEVLQGQQLSDLVEGLKASGLLKGYTHMLTGYIGSASFLRAVLDTARAVRAENPQMRYFCDPVMGDNGRLYVPSELVDIYREESRRRWKGSATLRDAARPVCACRRGFSKASGRAKAEERGLPFLSTQEVLPLASVLTPNQFEAELLTQASAAYPPLSPPPPPPPPHGPAGHSVPPDVSRCFLLLLLRPLRSPRYAPRPRRWPRARPCTPAGLARSSSPRWSWGTRAARRAARPQGRRRRRARRGRRRSA